MIILLLGLSTLASSLVAQVQFTRITTGPPVTDSHSSFAVALVDYDDDGDSDIFVANGFGQNNCLYRNDGHWQFTKITEGSLVNDISDSTGGVWADFDNDGDLDLFVTNWESPAADFFYRNEGGGTFTRITEGPWVNDNKKGNGAAWADIDNDGFVDLYVANAADEPFQWMNDRQGGVFAASGPLTSTRLGHSSCAWADYDNDGDSDLFVSCSAATVGQNDLFFENEGDGTFQRILTGPHVSSVMESSGVAWGDYDNDGDFDLFVGVVGMPVAKADSLYRNNGDRTFTRIEEGPIVNDNAFSFGAVWGDYDNDGRLDLFVSTQQGANLLYHNEGDGTFSEVLEGEIVTDAIYSHSCAWADFDADGFLDLYISCNRFYTDYLPEPNVLYRNQGNSNTWIMIRLVGTTSNRAGIGAKVRVRATIRGKEEWQLRQVSTGSGLCQGDLRVHFGLGDATQVDTLLIEWPSGIVQELKNVSADQILTVTEPARLIPQAAGGFQIQCWIKQSFEVHASTDLENWVVVDAVTNSTGTLTFEDSDIAQHTSRYYRVMAK